MFSNFLYSANTKYIKPNIAGSTKGLWKKAKGKIMNSKKKGLIAALWIKPLMRLSKWSKEESKEAMKILII